MSYIYSIKQIINWIKHTDLKFNNKVECLKQYNGTKKFYKNSRDKTFSIDTIITNGCVGKCCVILNKKDVKPLTFNNEDEKNVFMELFTTGHCDSKQYRDYQYILKLLNKHVY